MENLLIFFYILISISLILIILLQQGKGSDIGSAFGAGSSNTMFGSSSSSNPLTKVTAIIAAIFLILSLSITYISRSSMIEDSPIIEVEIDETGSRLYMIDKIVPDASMTSETNLLVEFKSRKYPQATEITKGPFTVTSSTRKVSTRAKGRQIAIKYSSTGTDDDWSIGDFRINAREDSLR